MLRMQPSDCLFRVSCLAWVAGELQQVVPGFVGFFPLEFPPSRRLGTEEKEQMALVQGQAAVLDFSGISRRKKELCQFEG